METDWTIELVECVTSEGAMLLVKGYGIDIRSITEDLASRYFKAPELEARIEKLESQKDEWEKIAAEAQARIEKAADEHIHKHRCAEIPCSELRILRGEGT